MATKGKDIIDHDLLIRIDEKVEGLTKDLKEMRDNAITRIDRLESDKLDRVAFEDRRKECDTRHEDQESRLRSLEKVRWLVAGGASIGGAVISLLVQYLIGLK